MTAGGQPVYIYALVDPRTEDVRYVGKAVDPRHRLSHHLETRALARACRKNDWLLDLLAHGLRPTIRVLSETDAEHWEEEEKRLIALLRAEGCDLTNVLPGGQGVPATALSGNATRLQEWHRAHPEAIRGENNSARLHPERLARGDRHPFRRNPSLAARGERCRHARLTRPDVSAIRTGYAAGESSQALADRYGVTLSTAQKAIRGDTWKHVDTPIPAPHPAASGERAGRAKLTAETVREIRDRRAAGEGNNALARAYGLASCTVSQIVHRTIWKHLD